MEHRPESELHRVSIRWFLGCFCRHVLAQRHLHGSGERHGKGENSAGAYWDSYSSCLFCPNP